MDMNPPQAPPAYTQSAYKDASDAFDRLVGLQAWLATEQAAIPGLPDTADAGALQLFLDGIDAYWNAPPKDATEGASRRAAFTARAAIAARDLAILGKEDGNLDDAALALVREMVSARLGELPPHIRVRELMFGEKTYAGVLLVQDQRTPDRTLVFSAGQGWESFPRLVDAHAEAERRARLALVQTTDLPGIARQDLAPLGPAPFVDSRDIAGDPFGTLVDGVIGVQRDKLRQAWFEYSLADEGDARTGPLVDTAFHALRLDRALDVETALATRHARLMERFNEQRLERVPAKVAADWRDADENYRSTLHSIAMRETTAGWRPPMDLPTYASAAIGERLKALGITENPEHIQIRIDRRPDVALRLQSLQALFEGPTPEHIKLVDLAYQNMSIFEPVRLSASNSDGTPIAGLDDATLRGLVHGLDLATRFQAYVDSTFRSGNDAPMRREHATSLQLAHMRLLATEARLSYYLDDAPRSFRPDRAERGYRWVEAALDNPTATNRPRVEGHDIVVRQMTYLGTPLRDVLAIGVRDPHSVPSIVLYTPDAPDGITFREFDDRAEAGRRFFYHPAFREYLLDRLPAEYARVLANGSAREFAGDHLANWVLGSSSATAYTRTQAPFEEREVSGDFLAAAYEVDVQFGLRNAQAFTRSAEKALWAWLVERLGSATTHSIVSDAVKGVVTAPARAAQAAWRMYDNVKAGDNSQAFVDFADFYNASLSAALPAYALGSTSAAHAIAGVRFRAAGRLVEARPGVQPTVVFEPRFVARHVRRAGRANREGVFTIEGKTYIEHGGQLYRVARDHDYATWRLTRPDAGSTFRGPAIQRTSAGTWAYRRVGLRGGSGRGQVAAPDRLPDLYDELQAEVELTFTDPLERELVATRIRFERTATADPLLNPPPLISPGQRLRWNDALNRARARQAVRMAQPGGSTPPAALDLRAPREGLFGGFRHVQRAQAPADLWYYGKMPFKDSDLRRHLGKRGYDRDMAELSVRFVDQGTHGVRVTTVPPTAPIEQIRLAMGRPDLARGTTFSVRIDPNSLYEPLSDLWRQRIFMAGDGANAELLAPNIGPANIFVVRPNGGGALRLGTNQFHVEKALPPPATP